MALCLFMLTSCGVRYKFKTEGLTEKDSSYLVTRSGQKIEAAKIVVKTTKVKVDGQEYPTGDLKAIKSKKMYFVVNKGEVYAVEMYGKINLMFQYSYGTSYSPTYTPGTSAYNVFGPGGSHQVLIKNYFLQKRDSTDIVDASHAHYIDYVSDNEHALRIARGSYGWRYANYAAAGVFAVGTLYYGLKLYQVSQNSDAQIGSGSYGLLAAGAAIPVYIATHIIANHKFNRAIRVYNKEALSAAE